MFEYFFYFIQKKLFLSQKIPVYTNSSNKKLRRREYCNYFSILNKRNKYCNIIFIIFSYNIIIYIFE